MGKLSYIFLILVLAFAAVGCKSKKDKEISKVMANKEEFIELLRSAGRPDIETVISHLDTTDFFTRNAGNHHKQEGGLVQHSLEVYRIMRCFAWFQKSDSIIIAALLHDLGKIDAPGWHPWRSVKLLGEWGFKLTNEEYYAIFYHHKAGWKHYRPPLRRALTAADFVSSGWWYLWHKAPKAKKNPAPETEEEE